MLPVDALHVAVDELQRDEHHGRTAFDTHLQRGAAEAASHLRCGELECENLRIPDGAMKAHHITIGSGRNLPALRQIPVQTQVGLDLVGVLNGQFHSLRFAIANLRTTHIIKVEVEVWELELRPTQCVVE